MPPAFASRPLGPRTASDFSSFRLLPLWEQEVCGRVLQPSAHQSTIYTCCEHNRLFAFSTEVDARPLLWDRQLEGQLSLLPLAFDHGVLVARVRREVEAYDSGSGRPLWKTRPKIRGRSRSMVAHPLAMAWRRSSLWIAYVEGVVLADLASGRQLRFLRGPPEWRHGFAGTHELVLASAESGLITAFDPQLARRRWAYLCTAGLKHAPAAQDGRLFAASHDGCLNVLDITTGRPISVVRLGTPTLQTPTVAADRLVLETREGLCALRLTSLPPLADPQNPEPVADHAGWEWTFRRPGTRLSNVVQHGSAVFVASDDGHLFGLDVATGATFWRTDLPIGTVTLACTPDALVAGCTGKVLAYRLHARGGGGRAGAPPSAAAGGHHGSDREEPAELPPRLSTIPTTPLPTGFDLTLTSPRVAEVTWSLLLPFAPRGLASSGGLAFLTGWNRLVAVAVERGEIAWERELEPGTEIGPWVGDGRVAVAGPGGLQVLDATRGSDLWRRPIAVDPGTALKLSEQLLVLCSSDGVLALSAERGEVRWQAKLATPTPCTPLVGRERTVVATADGLSCLGSATGRHRWSAATMERVTSPLCEDRERVFAACRGRYAYAFRRNSGALCWTFETRDEVREAMVPLPGERLAIAGRDLRLYVLDARTGCEEWSRRLTSLPASGPIPLADELYLLTSDSGLLAVGALHGDLLGRHDLGMEGPFVGPAASAGRLLVAGERRLVCLRPSSHLSTGRMP